MSWVKILTKNNKKFQKEIPKTETKKDDDIIIDHNIKNYDDEFDTEYFCAIADIKLEFKNYINEQCLPFLDGNIFLNIKGNTFYDFIKNNSRNLIEIKNKIELENEEYLRELEEDEENNIFENDEN